jgi:beta-lactam-binding protein with PASTA domain
MIVPLLPGGGDASLVPDLRGLSAREALNALARLGLSARLQGKGVVVEQTPAAGTPLERGVTCTLVLDRDLSRASTVQGAQP